MDEILRGRAGPMDVDSSDEWITTSVKEKNSNTLTSLSNSPFKLAQHIFSHQNNSAMDNENVPPNTPTPTMNAPKTPASGTSPTKSVGTGSTSRKRFFTPITRQPFSRKTPLQTIPSRKDDDKHGMISSTLNSHLYWPFVIMGYVQLAFNTTIVSVLAYFALSFYLTIRHDVQLKVNERIDALLSEIALCTRQYKDNRCDQRVPAIEAACSAWEVCMRRNPSLISRARLTAETFAEIINSFIEPISYKTMIFILMALFGAVFLSNYAFSLARGKVMHKYTPLNSINEDILHTTTNNMTGNSKALTPF